MVTYLSSSCDDPDHAAPCGVVLVTLPLCVGCARDPIRQQAEAVMSRTTLAGG